jgi:hypothetical protein
MFTASNVTEQVITRDTATNDNGMTAVNVKGTAYYDMLPCISG